VCWPREQRNFRRSAAASFASRRILKTSGIGRNSGIKVKKLWKDEEGEVSRRTLRAAIVLTLTGGEMGTLVSRFWTDEEGQDLTEYALLVTLVALTARRI
jgi:hypothetical protein